MTDRDQPCTTETLPELGAGFSRGFPASSNPAGWIDSLGGSSRDALLALGELLVGTLDRRTDVETARQFTARGLGVPSLSGVIDETRELNAVSCLTVALALAELIEPHGAQVGPQEATDPPAFVQRDHQLDARAALDRLYSRAAELNPYRGRGCEPR